jgi:hypothetical protein
LIINIDQYSILFQLVAGFTPLVFVFSRKNKILNFLIIHLGISFICSLLIFITRINHVYNLHIFNFYILSSSLFLPIFYFKLIQNRLLKFILIIVFLGNLSIVINELFHSEYLVNAVVSENITEIILCLFFLLDLLLSNKKPENQLSLLLINSSIFFYNCFSFLFNFYISEIMVSNLWFIHNFIEASSKLIIAYAFWKLPKTSQY